MQDFGLTPQPDTKIQVTTGPRQFAIDVVARLQEAGFVAYWAGGCVRDELLGLAPDDYDVATSAPPEQVQRLFRRTVAVGAAFGVIDVIGPKHDGEFLSVQVATFRSDGAYIDGRRPQSVSYGTAEADAARRDFTVNGLFRDPISGDLIDFVGGQADLQHRVLRAIGDPAARFAEDKLRLLRAVRMATRFDLTVDPATEAAAKAMAGQVTVVSVERIAEELRKLFAHPMRARGMGLLVDWGLRSAILPEATIDLPALARLPAKAGFELVLACLLRDQTKRDVEAITRRLKLSTDEVRRISWLVEHGRSLADAESLPPSRLYPLLAHPFARDLIDMHRAGGIDVSRCEQTLARVPREKLDPPPFLTGDDLKSLGGTPGPRFRAVLDEIRAQQLDGLIVSADEARQAARRALG
jgi:poly(A) polymerase